MENLDKEKTQLLFNIITTKLDTWYIEQNWLGGRPCRYALMSELSPSLEKYIDEWKSKFGELPVCLSDIDSLFDWLLWYRKEVSDDDVKKWFREPI